ncbi:metal ABC transporter substrate-binding protein [Cyanobium sp. ATX 6F1]|uniref:metal ABC transporter substrate-binding protein n=1 Tax=Cyanobium sp. ATX 6F1 TaxID=2823702 RepID=UPI0039656F76
MAPAAGLTPLVALLLLVVLGGCQSESLPPPRSPSGDRSERPLVLTTFSVLADMARMVAGDRLRVESITKIGAEIHGYEPTPSDIRRASGAVLVLENGFDLERWARRFTANLPGVPHVFLSAGITPLPIAADAYRGKPNPHAWMSPRLAEVYVENLRGAFTRLDPPGAGHYRRNAAAYRAQLRQLDLELRRSLASIPPQRRVLATCEGAFSYLARDYGLQEAYLWPVNAESQVTPQRMARLVELVRRRRVPAVFCETTVSDKAQRQVAQESGSRYGGAFYVDSLSLPGGPAPTLLELQRHNARLLVSGLKGE